MFKQRPDFHWDKQLFNTEFAGIFAVSRFCKCKSYSHFFSKNISLYAIFNDQNFNDMLTNKNIVSFEQLGPISV